MARYCFYCGRELASGEKCGCRTAGGQAGPAAGSSASSSAYASASASASASTAAGRQAGSRRKGPRQPKSGTFRRFFQSFNPFAPPGGRRQTASAAGAGRTGQSKQQAYRADYSRSRTSSQNRSRLSPQAVLLAVRQFGQYLARPADSVRQAVQSGSRRAALVILLLQSFCGGVFMLVAARQPIIRSLLSMSMAGSGGSLASGFFIFMQGFGISLAACLLLILMYQLALRFLFRQPFGFERLLTSLGPACLYFSLFSLAGLLSLPASLFSAAMMLLAGFAVAAIAQYLALRQLSGFDDNRSFILVTFVMLLFTGILAMLLNLSLPVLRALLDSSIII